MANKDYNFQYTPLTGRLPGKSFVKQTEQAINELAGIVNEGAAQVEVITNLANTANDNAEEALEKANEALETSGRVYITLPNLSDADDYYDSQLYYFANSYSHNLPVQDTGFLEVKTNDTKTACEQVFIADSTGLCYFRHGVITSVEVGSETVYSVTWDIWSSALASQDYVQQEVNTGVGAANDYTDNKVSNYLPLSGGTMTGNILFNKSFPAIIGNGRTMLTGGTGNVDGSSVQFYPYNYSDSSAAGTFVIRASNRSSWEDTDPTHKNIDLVGKPDGTLTWDEQPLLPVGIVQAFAGTTIPNGWLLCDGSAVSRTDYAALFAVIGTTYGAGDGTSTFNLPNLTDKFIQGNATSGTEHSAGLPNITGYVDWIMAGNSASTATGAFRWEQTAGTMMTTESGTVPANIIFNASLSNPIYGNSNTVQPPALTMKYIIKY